MADESESEQGQGEGGRLPASVASRSVEDLGTSSNPIVLDVSPIVPRINAEVCGRQRGAGQPGRTSRRKCPLGAYVEIIEEPRQQRTTSTTSNTRNVVSTHSTPALVQPSTMDSVAEHMDEAPQTDTVEEVGCPLSVPASFEIIMRCSICMEVFHNPASVSPCYHKFCYSCLLSWKRTNQAAVCPQCRGPIHAMQKDAVFCEVVESFLSMNPSKRRPESEIEILDAMESECVEYQNSNPRMRRRGGSLSTRNRTAPRDRTIRTPLVVRVSQIRAHRAPHPPRRPVGSLEFNV
ncbi:hypothetical protein Q1695_015484 [Nippostrongylus brasiliensis]|nr:hypothetical protein Q1695_015484 [Nippostrongylus brasiliensis]